VFNWFAVHPVAMNKTNTLINGDVKGWASNIMEKQVNSQNLHENFIAAFCHG
jgi:neutral ceramidase